MSYCSAIDECIQKHPFSLPSEYDISLAKENIARDKIIKQTNHLIERDDIKLVNDYQEDRYHYLIFQTQVSDREIEQYTFRFSTDQCYLQLLKQAQAESSQGDTFSLDELLDNAKFEKVILEDNNDGV